MAFTNQSPFVTHVSQGVEEVEMATIRKRGKRYQVQVRMDGQVTSKSFSTQKDVKAWGRETETRIDNGATLSKNALTSINDRYTEERSLATNTKQTTSHHEASYLL